MEAKVRAIDTTVGDRFGRSVALDGDFAVIGATLGMANNNVRATRIAKHSDREITRMSALFSRVAILCANT